MLVQVQRPSHSWHMLVSSWPGRLLCRAGWTDFRQQQATPSSQTLVTVQNMCWRLRRHHTHLVAKRALWYVCWAGGKDWSSGDVMLGVNRRCPQPVRHRHQAGAQQLNSSRNTCSKFEGQMFGEVLEVKW